MSKDEWLQKIMRAFHDAANLKTDAQLLGDSYTQEYSPYLKGQKIIAEVHGVEKYGIIEGVVFDQHSTLQGMARVTFIPYTKDWKKPIPSQNRIQIIGGQNSKITYCNFEPLKS